MICFFCKNPAAHPANECQYSENVVACEACTNDFWKWFKNHQYRGIAAAKANGHPTFYDSISSNPRIVKAESEFSASACHKHLNSNYDPNAKVPSGEYC